MASNEKAVEGHVEDEDDIEDSLLHHNHLVNVELYSAVKEVPDPSSFA